MAQAPLAEPLFAIVDATAVDFYSRASAFVNGSLLLPFQIGLTIYIILWGFAYWRGLVQEPVKDVLWRIIKIAFIGVFALKSGPYLIASGDWIYNTPQQLLDIVAPAVNSPLAGGNPANAIDLFIEQSMLASTMFQKALPSLSWTPSSIVPALTLTVSSFVIFWYTIFLAAIALSIILLAKVLLSVLIVLGPIFVAFLLFDTTRNLFNSWLGQVLGAMFTYIVAGVIMLFGMSLIMTQLNASVNAMPPGVMPALGMFTGYFFVSMIVLILLIQAPSVGSALGNGVAVGTSGAGRTAYRTTAALWRSLARAPRPSAPRAPRNAINRR